MLMSEGSDSSGSHGLAESTCLCWTSAGECADPDVGLSQCLGVFVRPLWNMCPYA